ncbi:MAG: FecR domain-containing protein [Opitutae bacterium]|nr:FecR domain-containing protein [Opitutae bacterium]
MNTRKLLVSLFVGLVTLTSAAFAQTQAAAATIARFSGNVTAVLPDGSSVTVTQGMQLPQGTTLTTGDKSDAYLVTHGDTTSVVTQNSEVTVAETSITSSGGQVTKQTTTLDLKSGNLVAKLNPAKKSVNNYSVRTPKGVAAARGTVFSVTYNNQTYRITVANGTVSFTSPTDGAQVSISGGQLSVDGVVTPISKQSGEGAALTKQELAIVAATVAVAAANNIGGTTSAEAQSIITTIIQAAPEAAAAIQAAVQASAPSISSAVQTIINNNEAAKEAVKDTPPPPTPQPIDNTTVSRSG